MVDDFGLVLGADAGEELAFGFGNAEPVEGTLDVLGDVVPTLALLFGGAEVVEDVVEVDGAEVGAPGRHRLGEEDLERVVTEAAHPLGFVLDFRDLIDDLMGQAFFGLEDGLFLIVEAVLVLFFYAFKVL